VDRDKEMMIHDVHACENAGSPALRVAPDKAYQKMLHESSAGGGIEKERKEDNNRYLNIKGSF
jgi:hypothetical protein